MEKLSLYKKVTNLNKSSLSTGMVSRVKKSYGEYKIETVPVELVVLQSAMGTLAHSKMGFHNSYKAKYAK